MGQRSYMESPVVEISQVGQIIHVGQTSHEREDVTCDDVVARGK
jgi:hypothetical protein